MKVGFGTKPFNGGVPTVVGVIEASQELRVASVLDRDSMFDPTESVYDHVVC